MDQYGYQIDPANSLATGVASGAQSGAPVYSNAGIYFGAADIGATSLDSRPALTVSNPATANAAASGGTAGIGATPGISGGAGFSGGSLALTLALVAVAVAAAVIYSKHKQS